MTDMKIAVLDYASGSVDIFDAPDFGTTEELDKCLEERGHNPHQVYFMSDVKRININI